ASTTRAFFFTIEALEAEKLKLKRASLALTLLYLDSKSLVGLSSENENPIRTLRDYSIPSHKGYRNTIELLDGNNVVPLRSDTIRLVQNGCSFHGLRFEDPNQHLKDFVKRVDSLDLDVANRERTRLHLQNQTLEPNFEARGQGYMAVHTKRMERFEKSIFKQRDEINDRMAEMFGLLRDLTSSRIPKKVLVREESNNLITKSINAISLNKIEEEKGIEGGEVAKGNVIKFNEFEALEPIESPDNEEEVEKGTDGRSVERIKEERRGVEIKAEALVETPSLILKSHMEQDTASTNLDWCQLDDLIRMWILGSLCDSLQEQVVTTLGNAKALWDHLKDLFHDNKDARAITLDNELRSIKIRKMTVNEYCTKIQSMANRLKNLNCQVSEKNLVIFTVNGHDSQFATLAEIIRHREPLPAFESVRNMLLLKESSFNDQTEASTTFESSYSSLTILMASSSFEHKGIVKPLEHLSLHTSSVSPILKSHFLALKDPSWCNAMYDEYNALVKNCTWILVPRPIDANLVRSMWLFKHKFHVGGTLSCYKARLVANGSSQELRVDFDETFSLIVKPATIRTVLSLVVSRQWPIHQLDVRCAFLNSDLSETMYMHQPPGFVDSHYPNHKKYALQLLKRAHMVNCNLSRTPVDTDSKLDPNDGTLDLGLHLYASATTSLVGYNDADWAGCPSTHRSMFGYCVFLANPVQHQRTKYIKIDIHFVRDMVKVGHVQVLHVPSRFQYADIFTKGLPSALFEDFHSSLSMMEVRIQLWNKSGRGPSRTMTIMSAEDTLKAKYMAEDASSKKFLISNFTNYKMNDSRPVLEQYNELLGILGKFTQHKINMDESIQVSCIIDKLPSSWKDFKHTLKHLKEELTLIELGSHLRIKESLRVQDSDKPKGSWLNIISGNIGSAFMSTSKLNDSILWHARPGHVYFKRMQDMSKDGLILAIDMDTRKCKTFMLNKITKKPFQNAKRETKVLELIHGDLYDLHTTLSLGNKKYFVTFINDASRAAVRLPDPKLKTLGERGIEYIFVGYAEHSKPFRFYFIKPNDSVAINSIIESRDAIFDEHRFSSVARPSQMSLVKGTGDSGGLVVSERVIDEIVQQSKPRLRKSKRHRTPKDFGPEFQLYLIEGTRDEVFDQHFYCFNVDDDPKIFDEAMKSHLIVHQMDVKTAFLNGELEEKFDASGKGVIICLYVDDMLIFGTNQVQVDLTKEFLSSRFSMKDIWETNVILGIRIKHESNVSTPLDTCDKLMPNKGLAVSQLEYSRVIGCLMYAMTYTRPNIVFVVGKLSRLVYSSYPSVIEGYTDASWISNTEDNSSISDWVFLLGGGAISWASKKQTCITGSIMESEFVAVAAAGKEAEWLKNLLLEIPLWVKSIAPISICCDSAATLEKAYRQMYNGKYRHLDVRNSMIRELITNGVVSIEFVRSQQNLADHLTKDLYRDLVIKSDEGMGLKSN
nr:zinc finger, CCHC-type [Tanacetum cinerariifolium]